MSFLKVIISINRFWPRVSLQFHQVWSDLSYSKLAKWVVYLWGFPHLLPTLHQSREKKINLAEVRKPEKCFPNKEPYLLGFLTCINKNHYTVRINGSTADILHHHGVQLVHFLLNNTRCVIKYHLQAKHKFMRF